MGIFRQRETRVRWIPILLLVLALPASAQASPLATTPQPVKPQPLVTLEVAGKRVPLLVDTGSAVPLVLFPGVVPGANKATIPVEVCAPKGSQVLATSALILPSEIPGARGILGWPVLKSAVWKLDLPSGTHQFLDAVPDQVRSWTSFPILPGRDSLAIRHPKLGEVFLDSGARRGVCLSAERWEKWKDAAAPSQITLAEGFSPASPGGAFANPATYGATFALEPLKLTGTNVGEAFFDPAHDGASVLLGLEALTQVTMIVDGPGKRVYFQQRSEKSTYQPVPPNRLQCAFLPDPKRTNALYVTVMRGGAGAAAGFQEGDLVISLDGSPNPPTFEQMHQLVRKSGAKVILGILRQRRPLQISFVVP